MKKSVMKYLKMTGFIVLYMTVFFACIRLFSFLIEQGVQTSLKPVIQMLLDEWGVGIVFLFCVPVLIYILIFRIRKKDFIQFCRFKAMKIKNILGVCIIGLATCIFTSHLINLSFIARHIPQFNEYVNDAVRGNLFFTLVMMGTILPFCEEILFHGLIFNEMRNHLPLVFVLFGHSLVYMVFQPSPQVAVFAYINYIIYALIFIFTDSLWGPVLTQITGAIGLFSLKLLGAFDIITSWGDVYSGIIILLSGALILFMTFSLKKKPLKEIFSFKRDTSEIKKKQEVREGTT
ncbi:MAG: CPBP family intramembrane metalloprotease [Spirochaetales bacterium]|nr:CPBP family intramembrane metalloprotease [Spirochaetales bacterium]